jgi:hypothetical protein
MEKEKLIALLVELTEQANELKDLGNSNEKAEGTGMLRVIEEVNNLMEK